MSPSAVFLFIYIAVLIINGGKVGVFLSFLVLFYHPQFYTSFILPKLVL